jgi:hypothetical protein
MQLFSRSSFHLHVIHSPCLNGRRAFARQISCRFGKVYVLHRYSAVFLVPVWQPEKEVGCHLYHLCECYLIFWVFVLMTHFICGLYLSDDGRDLELAHLYVPLTCQHKYRLAYVPISDQIDAKLCQPPPAVWGVETESSADLMGRRLAFKANDLTLTTDD